MSADLRLMLYGRRIVIGSAELYLADAYALAGELGRFDAMVTDPQYELRTSGGGKYRAARGGLDQIAEEGLDQGFDVSIINPLQCAAAVAFCHNDQVPRVSTHLAGCYVRFALCNWRKANPQPVANKHYRPDTELYFHAWSRGFEPQGSLADKARYWDGASPRGEDRFGHATPKPLGLMQKIIANVAGDSIIDPFMGTGSTGVAAVRAGRRFVGIEHNERWFEVAAARIAEAAA